MKGVFFIILLLTSTVLGQSGRLKPTPTPTPRSIAGPSVSTGPKGTLLPGPKAGLKPVAKQIENDETIKVSSVLVPIPVSVLDPRGRSVASLKLADFNLKVAGKAAEISEISRSETPIRLGMLFDNSSSVTIAREFEKEAAVRFFKRVIRPRIDRAALFSVADQTIREQDLTADVTLLTRAIELFPPPKGATALLDGIVDVAEYLTSTNGRRVIVIVSDGEDTISYKALEDVVKMLLKSDCQVYVVNTKQFENYKRTGERGGTANLRALVAERRMLELAEQTGGAVYSPINEDELEAAFAEISAELSQQYILNYYPEDDAGSNGDFRSLSVGVNGLPGVSVRTRKGYYVKKP